MPNLKPRARSSKCTTGDKTIVSGREPIMQLYEVTLYEADAGPDRSVSIQFWAGSLSKAQSRVYAELSAGTVILALKTRKRLATHRSLSPGTTKGGLDHVLHIRT